jgi:hypothetical protein
MDANAAIDPLRARAVRNSNGRVGLIFILRCLIHQRLFWGDPTLGYS